MEPPGGEVTQLLGRMRAGDPEATERLAALLYGELRRMAAARMRTERSAHTLSATALVHEAWLRLEGPHDGYRNRGQFLATAATAMRRVLVDHARARQAGKRDADLVPLHEHLLGAKQDQLILAVDEALHKLRQLSPRQCQVVEMRYFAGFTEDEVASALGVTRRTVNRDWQMAKAWLHARLSGEGRA